MGVTVPARISRWIAQAKIGRQIDYFGARRTSEQILDDLLRRAVRQRAEGNVKAELSPICVFDRTQRRQCKGSKLREYLRHRLADAAFGSQQHDLCIRMTQKQAHEFRAGIARCAEYADFRLSGTACC